MYNREILAKAGDLLHSAAMATNSKIAQSLVSRALSQIKNATSDMVSLKMASYISSYLIPVLQDIYVGKKCDLSSLSKTIAYLEDSFSGEADFLRQYFDDETFRVLVENSVLPSIKEDRDHLGHAGKSAFIHQIENKVLDIMQTLESHNG
jgi:hypothetical protein